MSDFTRRQLRSTTFGILTCLLGFASGSPAHAAVTGNVGWVLVDSTDFTGSYTADAQHSFNSSHGTVVVVKEGAGVYDTYFYNFFEPSGVVSVIATPMNSSNRCIAGQVGGSTTEPTQGAIKCYDGNGQLADTPFSLFVQTRKATFGSAANAIAYVQQTSYMATTNSTASYNSIGGTNTAIKSRTTGIGSGNYTVTFPGLTEAGGDIQVESYNGGIFIAQCKIVDWSAASKGTTATVQCYRIDNGNPNYSPFNIMYGIGEPFGLKPGDATLGAWLWANDVTAPV